MPLTKEALRRYMVLDELLSDPYHNYTYDDLTREVSDRLSAIGICPDGVTRRTIEKDLDVLRYDPFYAEIEKYSASVFNKEKQKYRKRMCLRYADHSYSIFKKEMTNEEKDLLREVLNTIGQFNGLENFKWLDDLKSGLGVSERKQIIYFSNNPYLKNSNLLGVLLDLISNKVAIKLSYHTFDNLTVRSIDFHPYLLKQNNDRWYLIGAADSDMKILNFALDRIDKVESLPGLKYVECPDDILDRFEDIVGVTLYEERECQHIICWASNSVCGYVETKPIHGSQTPISGEKAEQLRVKYPQLEGGAFFYLDCIRNNELIRELCSYGKDFLVLESDGDIKDEVLKRIEEMRKEYKIIRTKRS